MQLFKAACTARCAQLHPTPRTALRSLSHLHGCPPSTSQRCRMAPWEYSPTHTRLASGTRPISVTATADPTASMAKAGEGFPPASRTFILAVDSTPDSQYACRWALDNLARQGDCVHLVHCLAAFPRQGLYALPDGRVVLLTPPPTAAQEMQVFEEAQAAVTDWARGIFEPSGVRWMVQVVCECEAGPGGKVAVASQLCTKAQEMGAEALVVASRSDKAGLLGHVLGGSIGSWCAHHCETPVLVLHAPATPGSQSTGPVQWVQKVLHLGGSAAESSGETSEETQSEGSAENNKAGAEVAGGGGPSSADASALVSSGDFSEGEDNLIGQTVGDAAGADLGSELDVSGRARGGSEGASVGQGRHILVAVDDSEASERACNWAARVLWVPGDTLHLLRIIPSLPSVITGPSFGLADSCLAVLAPPVAAHTAASEAFMERRFNAALRAAGVSFEAEIEVEPVDGSCASVGRAVCARAERLGAVAVVVGSHMRGGLEEVVMGSTAAWVAQHCRVPVAVLH